MFRTPRSPAVRPALRCLSTHPLRPFASTAYTNPPLANDPAVTTTPNHISLNLRHVLESALRVDQAGELAANYIYMGQHHVLGRHPVTGPLIQVRLCPSFPFAYFHSSSRFPP